MDTPTKFVFFYFIFIYIMAQLAGCIIKWRFNSWNGLLRVLIKCITKNKTSNQAAARKVNHRFAGAANEAVKAPPPHCCGEASIDAERHNISYVWPTCNPYSSRTLTFTSESFVVQWCCRLCVYLWTLKLCSASFQMYFKEPGMWLLRVPASIRSFELQSHVHQCTHVLLFSFIKKEKKIIYCSSLHWSVWIPDYILTKREKCWGCSLMLKAPFFYRYV